MVLEETSLNFYNMYKNLILMLVVGCNELHHKVGCNEIHNSAYYHLLGVS
jgi:hypothetical protein